MSGSEYYNHSDYPRSGAQGMASAMRSELEAIEDGFGKLPTLIGTNGWMVRMKQDGTGMEAFQNFTDTTDGNVSTAAHGFVPKAPGNITQFLRGDGTWGTPGSASAMTVSNRTGNTQITTTDSGSLIRYTGTTNFTQTFAAPAVLTSGWFGYLHNTNTAEVELLAPGTVSATSVTSNSIAAATTWTLATGLSINPGDQFIARRTSDPFNQRITGTVSSYTSGTGVLVATVQGRIGSGTFTDWTITTGTATIDGLPSYVMYGGEMRLMTCDGTNLTSRVLWPYSITRTTSGFFVKPPGYRRHAGHLWGGGASGRKTPSAPGTGGAACHPYSIPDSALPTVVAFTIAAGGAANTGAAANPGGNSTFAGVVAYGGHQGGGGGILSAGTSSAAGLPADNSFGGSISGSAPVATVYGGAGGGSNSSTDPGGNSIYGGAGSGAGQGTPGTSLYGGNAGVSSLAESGTDGAAPGGAGGSTSTGATAGAGGRGELRAWGEA